MKATPRPTLRARTVLCGALLSFVALASSAPAADGPVIPLPADVAKDLELFGKGVVGKPVPAADLEDLQGWYLDHLGGNWKYKILSGDHEGKIRTETIKSIDSRAGQKAWRQTIGKEMAQYLQLQSDGSLGKYGEDDLSVGYGAHFHPGVFLPKGVKPGESKKFHTKVLAYKLGHPDETSYHGKMDTTLTYVGAYEVTTPAGTWPAVLIRGEFDVKIGPAKVKDVAYSFFAKDIGKVAEVEALTVAALLVYHSKDKTAKVLAEKPVPLK